MAEMISVELCGTEVVLCADRAAFLPRHTALLIADLHLGKAGIFRRHGIAVPTGGTLVDLQRLALLVETLRAERVYILGDVLHGAMLEASTLDAWHRFVASVPHASVTLIAGNHDDALGRHDLRVQVVSDAITLDGLKLQHHPPAFASNAQAPVICGHLHPVARIPGENRRFPAFWLRQGALILPAFSLFTGGEIVRAGDDERLFASNGSALLAL